MAHFNHCFRVAFLAVLFPLTSGACVDLDLGMGSRTIPDSKITASSEKSVSTPAKNGRLNFTSGSSWCAGTSDTNPYLQIDLQTLHIICAVSTQGNSQAHQWVKNYTLQLSTNGTTWTDYMEFSGQVKVLEGNKDRNSNVKHVVYGVLTRYLRFLPQKHQGEVCMRTEVFGVKQKPMMCEKQTPCLLSCQATSYIPFNYSWTKDGQVPTGDGIKLMNNSIIVTPRDVQDYGQYVCHATNSFGSTEYKITLLSPKDNEDDGDTQSIFLASVIALSCIVVVLLVIICGLIWQRRRAVPNRRTRSKEKVDFDGVKSSPDQQRRDQHASDPDLYMELKPRPSNQECHVPTEYQSLQEELEKPGYYNMVLQKENGGKQNEEVYEELC